MGDKTKIEWADASWNPIRAMLATPDGPKLGWHCVHVSEGCRNCYAESMNRRLGTGFDYKPGHLMRPGPHSGDAPRGDVSLFVDPEMLRKPLHWTRPRKIFVCSMTDLFGEFMEDAWIDQLFAIMALAPRHVFQVLTKRPERARAYILGLGHDDSNSAELRAAWRRNAIADAAFEIQGSSGKNGERLYPEAGFPEWPLPNVWLGTSVEDQAAADERIPLLLDTPAAIRWLSMEPLLGPVDLSRIDTMLFRGAELVDALKGEAMDFLGEPTGHVPALDWVVAGGESGKDARPMHISWPRQIRDQCEAAGVPFHFKQWGEWMAGLGELGMFVYLNDGSTRATSRTTHDFGEGYLAERLGKKKAGRELDGVIHDGYPA
jgi:protein gp37